MTNHLKIDQALIESYHFDLPLKNDKPRCQAVYNVLEGLNQGTLRVSSVEQNTWITNAWIKKAILMYFRIQSNQTIAGGYTTYLDKIPAKYPQQNDVLSSQIRMVPGGYVRYGAYIAPGCILMPSFVNIGAYIGHDTMIDTWATIGSCAQIGSRVHISGGVGIGGVLEPLQSSPTIIEDDCFIGARSEIAEGVLIQKGSVIGMGVFLSQSTKIYDRSTGSVSYGIIPPYSVVVPGSLPSQTGECHMAAAIIVKRVDEKTRLKTSINDLLRE